MCLKKFNLRMTRKTNRTSCGAVLKLAVKIIPFCCALWLLLPVEASHVLNKEKTEITYADKLVLVETRVETGSAVNVCEYIVCEEIECVEVIETIDNRSS